MDKKDQDKRAQRPPGNSAPAGRVLSIVHASNLAGIDVPERQWLVPNLIPACTVTMLGGDGATGKSLIALQLAVSVALGRPWLGFNVPSGNAVFVSAEDEDEEIHRRLDAIRQKEGVGWEDLDGLAFESLAGDDAILARPDGSTSTLQPTELWKTITRYVVDHQPMLLILDTQADLFGGDENNKTQARQFISMLRGLAIRERVTILLLSHPSLSGMSSGSGMSGNMAWNNSVRSRLYFERIFSRDGDKPSEDDPDMRVLTAKKANYGPAAGEWRVKWQNGVFVRVDDAGSSMFAAIGAAARAERIFMDLLIGYTAQGRTVASTPGPNYAPVIFAKDAKAEGLTKGILTKAMNALFATGKISNETTGPPSRRRTCIVIAHSAPG